MKNQLLDDVLVLNKDVNRPELYKRIIQLGVICFVTVFLLHLAARSYILSIVPWMLDFGGVVPLMQGFALSLALSYYTHHYGKKPWSIASGIAAFLGLACFLAIVRCFLFIMIGALILVLLGADMGIEERALFYEEHFWMDIVPMITDIVLVFYFFNPIPKKNNIE